MALRSGIIIFYLALLSSCQKKSESLFRKISSDQTGITFNNINVENDAINIFTYEYLYNGGGVAVGDINNDGLIDVYFSSNNLDNKLYLNKGNFKFEDITDKAGVGCRQGWKTGVSMVDINGDGWLDIYVCRSADSNPENRRNALLINNHDLTFTNHAKEYGLDDDSYSTQAAFFDYDLDGDLDCFILNHSLLSISNSFNISNINSRLRSPYISNRMLKNDNGHFREVTDSLGIAGGASNYGLGISISDVNNDGWPDLYVSNDYVDNDRLYLNDHGKKFINATANMLSQVSQFSMGNDIADINNDGFTDIFTLDMLPEDNKRQKQLFGPDKYDVLQASVKNGLYYQFMRNMLHLNNGNGTFSEIGQLAGISNTDWSWSALFGDYDNDGLQDLFVTNGYKRDFTNNDFLKYKADQEIKSMRNNGKKNYAEMLQKMPSNKLHNYIFKNINGTTFENKITEWGFEEKTLTNGAAYADLDNDGDLDLVMNNIDDPAGIYQNQAELKNHTFLKIKLHGSANNSHGIGAKVICITKDKKQYRELFPVRGFQSSVEPNLLFGFNDIKMIDTVLVKWPTGEISEMTNVTPNQTITISIEQSNTKTPIQNLESPTLFKEITDIINYVHREDEYVDFKLQVLLPRIYSSVGPCLTLGDVNGDGREDIFIGGNLGYPSALFIQSANGKFLRSKIACFNDSSINTTNAAFFDKDNDGDLDLYVATGGYIPDQKNSYYDCLFENDGKGNFKKITDALPNIRSNGACVRPADIDNDGDIDLFVGGRIVPRQYPIPAQSYILLNNGTGHFTIETESVAPELKEFGMITDARWIDINHDKTPDLFVVGEWLPISIFINQHGKLINSTKSYIQDSTRGWWNCIYESDIDLDGDLDLIVGNFGNNNQMKPSLKHPVSLYYTDIDKNGAIDPLLTYYIMDKEYPYANRDELTEQVPSIKKKFVDYESYSEAGISDVLGKDDFKNCKKLTATTFETVCYLNTGKGFQKMELPLQAQYAPVTSIVVNDFNSDSKPDLLLTGNFEKTRVRTGKFTGNYGVVLLGDGKGSFKYAPQYQSGLNVKGETRSAVQVKDKILFGISNSPLLSYRINSQLK